MRFIKFIFAVAICGFVIALIGDEHRRLPGMGGDITSLFIPSQSLGTGLKIGSGGLKGQQLAEKAMRLSDQGLDLIEAGRG